MRIGIKAAQIAEGGGLTHLNKIIEWFGKLAPENEFFLFGREDQKKIFIPPPPNFKYLLYKLPAINLPTQIWWERQILPELLRDFQCDLLFEPGNRGTLSSPCPKVSLIHNMAPFDREYLKGETLYQKARQSLLRKMTLDSMKTSDGIIFISNHSRNYFARQLDLGSKKTVVIYHGRFEGQPVEKDDEIIKKLGITGGHILSVSHIWRYKKIREMVQSYFLALRKDPQLPPLVIAGADYSPAYTREIKRIIGESGQANKVIFSGPLPECDLQVLYRNCEAFLFPSVIEACPNILIEAMSTGCAIACSNKGVMPEIAGGATLYFDPDNLNDFAAKIISIVRDRDLNAFLRSRARERALSFSWEKTGRQTLDFFNEVLGNRSEFRRQKSDRRMAMARH